MEYNEIREQVTNELRTHIRVFYDKATNGTRCQIGPNAEVDFTLSIVTGPRINHNSK